MAEMAAFVEAAPGHLSTLQAHHVNLRVVIESSKGDELTEAGAIKGGLLLKKVAKDLEDAR